VSPETIQLIRDLAPFGTLLTTIGGAVWVVLRYIRGQRDTYAIRLFESRKPFLELQLKLYVETAQVASKLAVPSLNPEEWNKSVYRFWELYWSELAVVEDERVSNAMERVGEALGELQKGAPNARQLLEACVLDLAHALRDGMQREWGAHIGPRMKQIISSG
jgi:hypothetical protein